CQKYRTVRLPTATIHHPSFKATITLAGIRTYNGRFPRVKWLTASPTADVSRNLLFGSENSATVRPSRLFAILWSDFHREHSQRFEIVRAWAAMSCTG